MLLDEPHDVLVDILGLGPHLIVEVGTVERALKLHSIEDTQVLLDIGANLISRRSSQCNDGSLAYLINDRTYAAIFRSEVMSPLGDTMSLVNSIEGNLTALQELDVIFFRQRLWSDVEQLGAPFTDISFHLVDSCLVKGRIEEMSNTFMLAEMRDEVHLVLHQSYQRRDDDSNPVHQQ